MSKIDTLHTLAYIHATKLSFQTLVYHSNNKGFHVQFTISYMKL